MQVHLSLDVTSRQRANECQLVKTECQFFDCIGIAIIIVFIDIFIFCIVYFVINIVFVLLTKRKLLSNYIHVLKKARFAF